MDIILDTNIICTDYRLQSIKFQQLFDYLKKNRSGLIVPQVVVDEAVSNYRSALKVAVNDFNRQAESVGRLLPASEPAKIKIDVESEAEAYCTYLVDRIEATGGEVLPYNGLHLEPLMKRAVNRTAPCNAEGEEIRDALIWHHVLDMARSREHSRLIFISNDAAFFERPKTGKNTATSNGDQAVGSKVDADSRVLRRPLCDELSRAGLTIVYFPTLDSFIKSLSVRPDFVTDEWLRLAVPLDGITDHIGDLFGDDYCAEGYYLDQRIERKFQDWDAECVEISAPQMRLDNVYCYERSDGLFDVHTEYTAQIAIDVVLERSEEMTAFDFRSASEPSVRKLVSVYQIIHVMFANRGASIDCYGDQMLLDVTPGELAENPVMPFDDYPY